MRAENHPWWKMLLSSADRTNTSSQRYEDLGQWATLVYQITGNRLYADKALAVIRKEFANTSRKGLNFMREYGAEYAVFFDWLYPAMSAADRSSFVAMLNRWADEATTNTWSPSFPIRTDDSDQTVGNYFQFAFLALATAQDNPRAGEFLARSYVGGLTPTAADRSSLRNAIKQYATQLAEGGVWPEGTQYNLGTLQLLMMGYEGVRTATGVDHFPEVTALLPQLAMGQVCEMSPDLKAFIQWGDTEEPRALRLFRRVTTLGMLGGLLQDDPSCGPYANQLVADFVAKYGAVGYNSAEPLSRIFYFYNPYAAKSTRQRLPGHFRALGQGLQIYHDGWEATDSLLSIHFPQRQLPVDHEVNFFGDFQLYRRGEWVLTHPLAYDGLVREGEGTNTMLIGGLSSMQEVKNTGPVEVDPQGRYLYTAGTTSGQYYRLPYYDPPTPFLKEWTRSFFYLPSRDKRSDTLVVFDRVFADPVARLDRYRKADQQRITAAPGLKQWIVHMPVSPIVAADGISWRTAGGQDVKVSTLLPASPRRQIIDEDATWPDTFPYPRKAEQKWQVRLMPPTDRQWDTFLNVVQAWDAGTTLRNTLVRSAGGEAEGVLVDRAGHPHALLLFGAKSTARVLTAGYTVRWSSVTTTTDLYLADLSPAKAWKVRVDGGSAVALFVSAQGLARVTVPGTGAHTVVLEAAG
jgi:hypothetical protein